MRIWHKLKKLNRSQHGDQWAYEAAANEVASGHVRAGLMVKALAEAEGDEIKGRAIYLKYLAEVISEQSDLLDVSNKLAIASSYAEKTVVATTSLSVAAGVMFFEWASAVFKNGLIAIFFGLIIGVWLSKLQDPSAVGASFWQYLFENIFSGFFWGKVIFNAAPSIIAALIIFSFLMFFRAIRENEGVAWFFVAIVTLLIAYNQWKGVVAMRSIESGSDVSYSKAYIEKLKYYEAEFPQINPDSKKYNDQITTAVAASRDAYLAKGAADSVALQYAVEDVLKKSREGIAPVRSMSSSGNAYSSEIIDYSDPHNQRCWETFQAAMAAVSDSAPLGQYVDVRSRAEKKLDSCVR